jgi:hypothetical protein
MTETIAMTKNKAPEIYKGAIVVVSAVTAMTAERRPMIRLSETAIPLPVVLCADGNTSAV